MSNVLDLLPAAILDANAARAALAGELALSFAHNPQTFDPRCLERLGHSGLSIFLQSIGESRGLGEMTAAPVPEKSKDALRQKKRSSGRFGQRASGWTDLRRPERSYWMMGVVAGVRAGGLVLIAGTTGFVLAAYAFPVLKGAIA